MENYKAINILLGNACDMNCPYCLQGGGDIPANKPADIEKFSEMLANHLKGRTNPKRIIFWGGEPMLYFEKIKRVISECESRGIEPTEKYSLATNGQRMSDEYVDFVNQRNFLTTISTHDWNFTNDQYERFFRLKHMTLGVIIHREHLDFWDLRERFYQLEDLFGVQPFIYLHFLRATEGCDPRFYLRTEDVDRLCRHLLNDVLPLAVAGDDWANHQCRQLLYEHARDLDKTQGSMCVRDDRLSLDLHGNTYACHHNFDFTNITGNLAKRYVPIQALNSINPHRFSQSVECRECEIFGECHGGCYLSKTHEIDCYLKKKMHSVYQEFEKVFGIARCL